MARSVKIKVTPDKAIRAPLRRKRKPRKTRLSQIQVFNRMVDEGRLAGLKFDKTGDIVGADKYPHTPTAAERQAIHLVKGLLVDEKTKISRDHPFYYKNRKWTSFMKKHGRKGAFTFVPEAIELEVLEGESPDRVISITEQMNGREFPHLRKLASRFDTRIKVTNNLVRQLRYFEKMLRDANQKEMIIHEDESQWDENRTVVRITDKGIVKETFTKSKVDPIVSKKSVVLLLPNNEIRVGDIIRQK